MCEWEQYICPALEGWPLYSFMALAVASSGLGLVDEEQGGSNRVDNS